MAIAQTRTWLPLDTWAKIMGYNPWTFNGFAQFPNTLGEPCSDVWIQEPGQQATMSREELAIAIREAENMVSEFVGYKLLPDWDSDLVIPPRFNTPPYFSSATTYSRPKSVRVKEKYLIQLGVERRHFLQNVAIVRVDLDNDGFAETGRITIAETTLDPNQVRIFYPDQDGDEMYEIRPVKSKGGGIFEFPMYLVPQLDLIMTPIVADPLDVADPNNFLATVDVYQVYNDTTTPVTLLYNGGDCATCEETSTAICGTIENEKLGYVNYITYTDPDKIRVNYLAGWQGRKGRPLLDLDPYWQTTIAYLAPSLFAQPVQSCCGGNQAAKVSYWANDVRKLEVGDGTAKIGFVTQFVLENPFGILTNGAWYAFNRCRIKRL